MEDNNYAIGTCELSRYDALVVAATSAFTVNFSAGEVLCVRNFVDSGGGLLILGERPGFANRLGALAGEFGLEMFLEPEATELSSWSDHPILDGVSQIVFEQGGGIAVSGTEMQLVAYAGSGGAIAVSDGEQIRVVAVGDANLFDDRWLANNHSLAISIFKWVTRK